MFIQGLEIDGNAKGDTDFICSGVSFAYGVTSVVDFAGNQISFESGSFVMV